MLNDAPDAACTRFREAFEAGRQDRHRDACPACRRWAAHLESLAALRAAAPMPAALADRLRGIPAREVVCRDVDRLYADTRAAARGGARDFAARRHLAACARCRRLYGVLRGALAVAALPLPGMLAARLAAFAQRPRQLRPLPVWIRDGRLAAAASLILTAFLTLFTGDLTPLVRDAALSVGDHTASWWIAGGPSRRARLEALTEDVERQVTHGADQLVRYGVAWKVLLARSQDVFIPTEIPSYFTKPRPQGDSDEQSERNAPTP